MSNARNPADRPTSSLPLIFFLLSVAALSWARDVFIPLALAVLLSFLLSPVVSRIEKWGLPRIPAVVATVLIALVVVVGTGWVVGGQVVDLADQLPRYKTTIARKLAVLDYPGSGPFRKAVDTIEALRTEASQKPEATTLQSQYKPLSVEIVKAPTNPLALASQLAGYVASTVGMGAVVFICVIFFLIDSENIRDRFIFLAGKSRVHTTTQALNDAAERVSRYLFMQMIVNVTYALPVMLGLLWIGVPNAMLWGLLCAILRFIPYFGPLLGAAFPIAVSIAVFDNWTQPVLTVALFAVVEVFSNNVIEPWLYASSTGLSATAIVVAAIFWTWLWGGVGLLLATPLTVCLAVIGKYIPALSFLDVLLGAQPAMPPGDRLYQRLLAFRDDEAAKIARDFLQEHPLQELFDHVLLPALQIAEQCWHREELDDRQRAFVHQSIREIVVELGVPGGTEEDDGSPLRAIESQPAERPQAIERPIVFVPAANEADEVAALMVSGILTTEGYSCIMLSAKALASEIVEQVSAHAPSVVCVSATPPLAGKHARYLCKRLDTAMENFKFVVCLWGTSAERVASFRETTGITPVTTVADALSSIKPLAICTPVASNTSAQLKG